MKILIKNCNLISMDDSREKIEYGVDILIDEEKFQQIGKNISLNETQNVKIIIYHI